MAGDDHAAAIAVRDYGVGLAPGESAMVFNRFWRADPARARTSGGTGLGLSISLEDTHLHGGWLQAWGRPGEGAQFRLTLPRRAGQPLRQSPLPLVPEDAEETVVTTRRARGRRAAVLAAVLLASRPVRRCRVRSGCVADRSSRPGSTSDDGDPGVFIDPSPRARGLRPPTSSRASSTR